MNTEKKLMRNDEEIVDDLDGGSETIYLNTCRTLTSK